MNISWKQCPGNVIYVEFPSASEAFVVCPPEKNPPWGIPYTGRDHLVRPVLTDTRFAYRARVVVLKGYEKMSISATQNTETYYMYILKYYKFSILPAKHNYHKPTIVQVWYISILHFPDPWSIFVLQRRFLHLSRGVVIAPTYFQHGNHIWNSYSDRWPSSQSFANFEILSDMGHFANGNGHILSVWSTIQANYEQTIPAVTGTATAMVYTFFLCLDATHRLHAILMQTTGKRLQNKCTYCFTYQKCKCKLSNTQQNQNTIAFLRRHQLSSCPPRQGSLKRLYPLVN